MQKIILQYNCIANLIGDKKSIIIMSLLFLMFTVPVFSQITIVGTTSGQTTGTSLTFAHDRGTADNTLTLVSIQLGRQTAISGNVTYGGTAMTLVGTSFNESGSGLRTRVLIYRIFNAATGNQNVVVNVSATGGDGPQGIVAGATSFSNVDPTTPLRAYVGTNGDAASSSVSVQTGPGDIVFGAIAHASNTTVADAAGQTQLWQRKVGTSVDAAKGKASVKTITSGTITTFGFSSHNDRFAMGAVSIRPNPCTVNASVSKVDAVCGGVNGSITFSSPSGGSGAYEYRLGTGTWQTSATFTGLAAGTYSPQVRDANNTACAVTLANQIIASGALQATVSKTDQVCGTYGTITFSAPTGGSGTFQYRLNSGTWQNSASFTNLAPGNYTPEIRDAADNSCTATLSVVAIAGLTGLDSDGDGIPDSCDRDDDNDGILDINEDVTDFLESWETNPLLPNVNGNNFVGNTFGSWSTQNGATMNLIRVNGAGYASGADNAVSGSQYLDIAAASDFPIYPFLVSGVSTINASAWFSNRESTSAAYNPWNARLEVLNSSFAVVASGPIIPFNSSVSMETWLQTSLSTVISTPGQYYIRIFVDNYGHADDISLRISSDADSDTLSNQLDTDSDNDGCPDAIEGGGNFTLADLDGNGRLTGGVNAFGIPNVALAGQTRGGSYVASQLTVTTPPTDRVVSVPAAASFTVGVTADNNTSWSGPTNARIPVYGTFGNGNAQTLYQWYLGNPDNGGTILANSGVYSGVTTATLGISNTTGLSGNEYYVVVSHSNNTCIREVRSARLLCVKPGLTSGGTQLNTNVWMSVMQNGSTGPETRNNAHVVLESKTKGFVITRVTTANLPTGADAVKGMLVYDTTENCLKMYNGTTWGCLTAACPD